MGCPFTPRLEEVDMLDGVKREGDRPHTYEVWLLSLRIKNFMVLTLKETPNLRKMKWSQEGGVLAKSRWLMVANVLGAPKGRIPKKCRKGSGLMKLRFKG